MRPQAKKSRAGVFRECETETLSLTKSPVTPLSVVRVPTRLLMLAAGAWRRWRKRAMARSSLLWALRRIIVDHFSRQGRRAPVHCDNNPYQGVYTQSGSHGVFQLNTFPTSSGNSRTVVMPAPHTIRVATRANRWQRCQISGVRLQPLEFQYRENLDCNLFTDNNDL